MTVTTIPAPNITNITALAEYANIATGSMFWNGLILAIWITLFFALKGFKAGAALVASSFVCAILAFLLAIPGLVNPLWMIFFLLLTAGGMFFI